MKNNNDIGNLMNQLLLVQKCSDDGKETYKTLAGAASRVMHYAIKSDSEEDKNAALYLGTACISMLEDHINLLYDSLLDVTAGVSGELIKAIINDQHDDRSEDENDNRWLYL